MNAFKIVLTVILPILWASGAHADIERIVYGLPFEMPTMETPIETDSDDLTIYNGTFISKSNGMKLNIQNTEDRLFARLAGKPAFEIYPKGNHQFFEKKVDVTTTFEIQENVVSQLTAEEMGQIFHFKKSSN